MGGRWEVREGRDGDGEGWEEEQGLRIERMGGGERVRSMKEGERGSVFSLDRGCFVMERRMDRGLEVDAGVEDGFDE